MPETPASPLHRIAFSMAKGMQGDAALEMLRRINSPERFFTASAEKLKALTGIASPIFADAYRRDLLKRADNELKFIDGNGIRPLFIGDTDFPGRLEQCTDAPVMLYKLGSCPLNAARAVAVVGTRHSTHAGTEFTTRLVSDLASLMPGTVIVSGLAFGIDIAAHRAAINCGLPTIAVLAHGLNTIYPSQHRSWAAKIVHGNGALLTEYTSDCRIFRGNFLARNRIVAGLCDCIVVVESDTHGGAMSTARIASSYGREVFAVPGRPSDQYSRGTNKLIANHSASLITCAQDLVELMGWEAQTSFVDEPSANYMPEVPEDLRQIYDYVLAHPDDTINDICTAINRSVNDTADMLFRLEMADLVMQLPGGKYAPTSKR